MWRYPSADDNMHVSGKHQLGFTLHPQLVAWTPIQLPASLAIGTILEDLVVENVENGLGLVVRLLDSAATTSISRGFVHISRIDDERTETLDAKPKLKVGSRHTARVVGFDYVDGILQLSMQPSVLNAKFFRYEDVKIGQVVDAVILKVDIAAGLLVVQLSEGIRAICTRYHLSDLPTVTKMEKRFRVGDKIKVRVLTCDPANRKVSVTHKKTMVASTLPIVDSLAKADELLRQSAATPVWSYGIVTAVRPFGCIVSFFGDARGLVHVSDLSNQFVTNPSESFTNGQLVKCRLVSVDTADSKLKLSLCAPKGKELARSAAAINAPMSVPLAIGHIFSTSATVIHVDKDKRMAVLRLTVDGQHVNGVIHLEHMSDHVAHNAALFAALHPNGQIDEPLAVIGADRDGIVLTMKPALVHTFAHPKTSAKFPASINDITVGDVVIGHVHHVEAKLGAFVNFANDVCGLVYKSNISDDFVTNAADFVCVGQTVLAVVSDVDREQQRVSLSLKASDLSSSQHIVNDYRRLAVQSYAKLAGQSSSSPADVSRFGIGATVEMTVQSIIQDVCTVGVVSEGTEALLTSKLQEPGFVPVIGAKLSVRIVDANVERGVIDVTNRVDLMAKPPKKVKKAPVPSSFTIVLVKEDYLVLTAPELASGFAFALTNDLNDMRKTFGRFALGQTVSGSLLPIAKKDHKVWVLLTASGPVSSNGKKGGSRSALIAPVDPAVQSMDDIKTGLVTKGLIRSIKNTQMNIILVRGDPSTSPPQPAVSGRVHISQLVDDIKEIPVEKRKMNAFAALGFTHGATIDVAVVGFHDAKTHRTLPISHLQSARTMVELSVRGSVLRGEDVTAPPSSLRDVHVGQVLNGFISELPSDNKALTWVSLGTQLTGRLNVLDMSDDPVVLTSLDKHFSVGMAVRCRVLSKNEEKGNVDLSLFSIENDAAPPTTGKPTVGRITAARVTKISPENGLTLQFSHGGHTKFGHVALVDIADSFETAPTEKFTTGMFVRCCIVASTSKHIDLSLRTSRLQPVNGVDVRDKELSSIDDLTPGQLIRGFVKNVAQGGLFISIGRNLVARVKIGELFDEFVKEWQDKFGEGQLVTGRVRIVDAESGHVELSLKPSAVDPDTFVKTADTGKLRMEHLEVGHVVTGTIARVEKYGVFVDMDNTQGFGKQRLLRGMCHRNELADEEVKNVASAFAVGDRVKAKVLAVETESKRINLGLKSSYFDETADVEMAQAGSAESSDDEDEELKVARSDDEDEDLDEASVSGADSTTDNESNAADIVDDQVADSDDMDLASNNESESEDSENLLDSAGESDLSSEEDEDKIDDEAAPITVANSDSPLEVSPGFQWGATDWNPVLEESSEEDAASVGSDDSDSDADNASADSPATKKKSKRAKAKAKRDEELAITQKESEALAEPMAPETASDFDRYLLATPNSSFLWIQYMYVGGPLNMLCPSYASFFFIRLSLSRATKHRAFYVNMVEIEKARQIAERALKVIHFREEKEKFK